jgi:hypothetical protein
MGLSDDDEDFYLSPSDPETFQNPSLAKERNKDVRAKQAGKLQTLKRWVLRSNVEENKTMSSAAKLEVETKRSRKAQNENMENEESFGTKTNLQMEEHETLDGDKQFTTDDMVEKEKSDNKKKEDLKTEMAHEDA